LIRPFERIAVMADPSLEVAASMPRHLFIVSREVPHLADYMRLSFANEPEVQVLVDRRVGPDRRTRATAVVLERRTGERRAKAFLDHQLRQYFHALVPARRDAPE
jgi:hypothetical protein